MSVFKRKTTAGETSEYHYRFMKQGKMYFGVCSGCFDKDSALAFENTVRGTADELSRQKSVKAVVENFCEELSGGEKIELKDAFRRSLEKPRRHKASKEHTETKESQFGDFARFMSKMFPEIKFVNQVQKKHAEAYIQQLRGNGRFYKKIDSKSGKYENKNNKLSTSTINRFHKTLREVFSLLSSENNLYANPFSQIPLLDEDQETREPFTETELEKIIKTAPPFIYDIFMVGFFTALREGDIATLMWSDILWDQGIIRRKLLKTGAIVEIPIMPPLADFLKKHIGLDEKFVLPEHAAMYKDNPTGISYRVKKFLEDELHIKTTKKVEGRSRAVSIKDVHSLRHTFCYFAGVAGIPLVVVQSIVGHMNKEMTDHYTAHADRKTKREKLAALPCFKSISHSTSRKVLTEQTRNIVLNAVQKADEATLDRIASILIPNGTRMSRLRNKEQGKSM